MASKTFDPHLWKLEDLFNSIYNVPVYQRPYSWDKEQIDTLMTDIIDAYRSDSKDEGYYTGNIIVFDKNEKINGLITKYDIIDGQQRITSFALILLALYTKLSAMGVDASDKTVGNIKSALWKYVGRQYHKELKAVTLNSIEKKCFSDLYDSCFDNPQNILSFCKSYNCISTFERRVISNFENIFGLLGTNFSDDLNEILDFSDYILQYIQFIVIEANCKANKVFSMFESINSKGKKLEEIDLIKTYIFSKLDEKSYDTYLNIWGKLIIETNDNLYDYLYNYIKAFLSFYRNNINVENFKTICRDKLQQYFNETDESEALKKLLDDMYEKVKIYNMLSSAEEAYKLVKSSKFRFYFKIFIELSYKHPKALFLRTLTEFSQGKISKSDVVEIISETVSLMMQVLSIGNRDSKDVISMFSTIMTNIYLRDTVSKDDIVGAIASELVKQGITPAKIKADLQSMDAYEKNKMLTVSLLSLYDATTSVNGKAKISYDQAYTILNSYRSAFSLDHLLVQTPEANSKKFKYYKDSNDALILKSGHDFPAPIANGMDYNTFTREILNKIGNLRIYYKDKNSGRQNTAISLPEYPNFYSYAKLSERGKTIVDMLVDVCLPTPDIDISKIKTGSSQNLETALPKMEKLIEYGLVNKGDKIYLTQKPEESVATLLDEKYVDYNGEKMTLNDWGCKLTGWKSIRIYAYTAIVGEVETLQAKRLRFIEEHNE